MRLNPVERRLLQIRTLWEGFTGDSDRRLLIWQAPSTGLRLIECFFEAQKHEAAYSTRDLCIILKVPFEHSIQYARGLKRALAEIYAASRDGLVQEGIEPDWAFEPDQLPDSAYGFAQALRSFGARHHTHIGHLAAVLMPPEVESDRAFAGFLSRALAAGLPERLRLVVTDPAEAPRLNALAASGDPRIAHEVPPLDVLTLAQETFAQEPTNGPGGVFRSMLMSLVTLVEKAPASQVRSKAADAFDFARRHGWNDQQAAVAVLVAGAQLKESRNDEAIVTYRIAREAAEGAVAAGHPAGRRLVLMSVLGEAGAALAAGRPADAGLRYDDAAELALAVPDLLLAIEAQRMGAFCRARGGDRDGAVERGRQALATGQRLRAEVRGMTTLPIAANDLLRVLDQERAAGIETIVSEAEAADARTLDGAEAHAATLERVTDRDAIARVEQRLASSRTALRREAEARLEALVAAGDARFRAVFASCRTLLGAAWPLGPAPVTEPAAS